MPRRNHMRSAAEKRRIAKEYARAIRQGERGRDVLERYGVNASMVRKWSLGECLGIPGQARNGISGRPRGKGLGKPGRKRVERG